MATHSIPIYIWTSVYELGMPAIRVEVIILNAKQLNGNEITHRSIGNNLFMRWQRLINLYM